MTKAEGKSELTTNAFRLYFGVSKKKTWRKSRPPLNTARVRFGFVRKQKRNVVQSGKYRLR